MEKAENTRYAAVAVHSGYGLSQIIFFVRRRYAVADSKDIKRREMREEGDWKVRREERTCEMREALDHRRERERLVSLVRLSSELALPVKVLWLACVIKSRIRSFKTYLHWCWCSSRWNTSTRCTSRRHGGSGVSSSQE